MGFWNQAEIEPSRKYRFQIQALADKPSIARATKAGDDIWWWAKSITKPSYEVNVSDYKLTNHKFKYPGVVSWSDISITVVDPGGVAMGMWDNLGVTYTVPTEDQNKNSFAKMPAETGNVKQIILQQLGSNGKPLETWTLHDAFVKSVAFGDLAYADDGLVEITIGLSYDYATLAKPDSDTAEE